MVFLCPKGGRHVLNREEYLKYLKQMLKLITDMAEDCGEIRSREQVTNILRLQFQIVREIYRLSGEDRNFAET